MKTIKFKHPRRVYLYVLLSFLRLNYGCITTMATTPTILVM